MAAQREARHEVAVGAEAAGAVVEPQVELVVELAPRATGRELGPVARGQVLARAEAVDHVGRVELLAVETRGEQHQVAVVERGVEVGGHLGAEADARVVVARREEEARPRGAEVARVAAPQVEVAGLDQQLRVGLDEAVLRLDVAVGDAHLVVGGAEELLAQPQAELRVVEVAPGRKVGREEAPQQVGELVFEDVAPVGEVAAVEVGLHAEEVARAQQVGVVEPHHGAPLAVQRAVDGDRPAVARADREVDAHGVERVAPHLDVDVGEVGARAQQLLVAAGLGADAVVEASVALAGGDVEIVARHGGRLARAHGVEQRVGVPHGRVRRVQPARDEQGEKHREEQAERTVHGCGGVFRFVNSDPAPAGTGSVVVRRRRPACGVGDRVTCAPPWLRCTRWRGGPSGGAPWG